MEAWKAWGEGEGGWLLVTGERGGLELASLTVKPRLFLEPGGGVTGGDGG